MSPFPLVLDPALIVAGSLFRGNLVLECPVPTPLLDLCPIEHRKEQEFALMRYTAVTCGPDDFAVSRRRVMGAEGRLLIMGLCSKRGIR